MSVDRDPSSLASVPAVVIEGLGYVYPGPPPRGRGEKRSAKQTSTRDTRAALCDIHLQVKAGSQFALVGPNGSGKTTLLRLLTTSLRPQQWPERFEVLGMDLRRDRDAIRRALGVVFQSPSLDEHLTVVENLWCHGRLYAMATDRIHHAIEQALERMQLADRRHERVSTLSGGLRRRVELAKVLMHTPALLLLDEATDGLDPTTRRDFWQHVAQARAQGVTVIFTTHRMEEAQQADEVALMSEGRILRQGSPADLMAEVPGQVLVVEVDQPLAGIRPADLAREMQARFGQWMVGESIRVDATTIHVATTCELELMQAVRSAWPQAVRRISVGRPSLEDVYFQLTQPTG